MGNYIENPLAMIGTAFLKYNPVTCAQVKVQGCQDSLLRGVEAEHRVLRRLKALVDREDWKVAIISSAKFENYLNKLDKSKSAIAVHQCFHHKYRWPFCNVSLCGLFYTVYVLLLYLWYLHVSVDTTFCIYACVTYFTCVADGIFSYCAGANDVKRPLSRGEHDLILVHPLYGVIIICVKSVGSNFAGAYFRHLYSCLYNRHPDI